MQYSMIRSSISNTVIGKPQNSPNKNLSQGFFQGAGGAFAPLGFGLLPLGNFVLSVNHFTSKLHKSYLATS